MSKAPAFQFYASDFLVDTAEMTNQEVGVYIRLLSHQWVNGNLNSDPNRLANVVGIDLLEVWPEISCKFVLCEDGKLRNPKLEKVRQTQIEYRKKQAEAGKKGAAKRWDKDNSNPNSNPNGETMALQSSSSSSSSSKPSKIKTRAFAPPSISEVKEYVGGKNYHVDADNFINFYESKGWMVGKNKMKDWKACIRTWEKRDSGKNGSKKSISLQKDFPPNFDPSRQCGSGESAEQCKIRAWREHERPH